jgi:hypothetical protein
MVANEIDNTWQEYSKLILAELERMSMEIARLNAKLDAFRSDDIANVKVELAMLKVKAGMWGAVAGAIPTIAALLFWLMSK